MFNYSKEHILYLKKIKKEIFLVHFFRIVIIISFILLWEILARSKVINTFLFSSPSKIFNTIIRMSIHDKLFYHIGISLWEVLLSFLISFFIGLLVATILWRYRIISKIFDPYIMILNSLPKVALGPLIIIWMGARINSIIFMSLTISLFSTIINWYIGFKSVPKNEIILMKSFKATNFQIYSKLILPSNIENIVSTLKINISMNFIGVIMGELLVSKVGLGYLIMYGSQVFNLDLVLSSIFILGILSFGFYSFMDFIIKQLKKKR